MKNGPYELVAAPADYPGKRYRGKYAYEHHVVWWQSTGNVPPPGFDVHHKNEQKRDNRFCNLELLSKPEHTREHVAKAIPRIGLMCEWCGERFTVRPNKLRERKKNSRSGKLFCSTRCSAEYQFSPAQLQGGATVL